MCTSVFTCVYMSMCLCVSMSACASVCVCKYMTVSLSFATPSWMILDFSLVRSAYVYARSTCVWSACVHVRTPYLPALVRSACGTFVCETHRHVDIHTHRCIRPSRYVVRGVLGRGGGLGSNTIFKKFHETYAPS